MTQQWPGSLPGAPQPQYPGASPAQAPPQSWLPFPDAGGGSFGAPPGGSPQYPPPGYPWAPYGALPPQPPRKKPPWQRALIVVAVVVAFVVSGAVTKGVVDRLRGRTPDSHAQRFVVPDHAGAYQRSTSAESQQVLGLLRDGVRSISRKYRIDADDIHLGVFARTGSSTPAIAFYGASAHDSGEVRASLRHHSLESQVAGFFVSAGSSHHASYPSGSLGGLVSCGDVGGAPTDSACVWVDRDTLGVVLGLAGQREPTLAAEILQFRAAAELPA